MKFRESIVGVLLAGGFVDCSGLPKRIDGPVNKSKFSISLLQGAPRIFSTTYDMTGPKGIPTIMNRIMIKGVRITNTGTVQSTVRKCDISFKGNGVLFQVNSFDESRLAQEGQKTLEVSRNSIIQSLWPTPSPYGKDLAGGATLNPGQTLVLANLAFENYTAKVVDKVEITCGFGEEFVTGEFSVIQFEQKNRYSLPLRGTVFGAATSLSLLGHRWSFGAPSQEHAIDFHVIGKDSKIYVGDWTKSKNYNIFGASVYAPGEGTVIDAQDGSIDHPFAFRESLLQSEMADEMKRLTPKHGVFGNFVIIDHGHQEYTLMSHLKNSSIRVKRGQKIKRGDWIANVGNSGASSSPHLHFQLMAAADPILSTGLPIKFDPSITENGVFTRDMVGDMAHGMDAMFLEYGLVPLRSTEGK